MTSDEFENKKSKKETILRIFASPFLGLYFYPIFLLFIIPLSVFFLFDIHISLPILQLFVIIAIILGILTAYPLRYSPLKLIDKFHPHMLITNYHSMKYSFQIYFTMLITLVLLRYFNFTEMFLPIEFISVVSIYFVYLFSMTIFSIIFCVLVYPNQNYVFAVSKAYCMRASKSKKEIYQSHYLIKSIESYNVFLKKHTNITLDINKQIILKFVNTESKIIFIKKLLSEFNKEIDENNNVLEPMKYLLKEFGQDVKLLKQNIMQDQIIKLVPIIISIILGSITLIDFISKLSM